MMKKFILFIIFALILSGCNKNELTDTSIQLDFNPIQSNIELQIVDYDIEIIKEITVGGYKAILFRLNQEGDIYGGVYIKNEIYSIGSVSMNLTPDNLLAVAQSDVFGKNLIRFSGILGANYARSVYIEVENSSVKPLIEVDGNIVEVDLDEDGIKEVVTTIGTIPNISIYRIENNYISVSNINASISAQAVLFNREIRKFRVYFEPNQSYFYIYSNGRLDREKDENK